MTQNLSDQQIIADWKLPSKRNSAYNEIIKSMNTPDEIDHDVDHEEEEDVADHEIRPESNDLTISSISIRSSIEGRAEACLALAFQIFYMEPNRVETNIKLALLQKHISLLGSKSKAREQVHRKKSDIVKVFESKTMTTSQVGEEIVSCLQKGCQNKKEKDFDSLARKLVSHLNDTQYNAFKVKVTSKTSPDYSKILITSETEDSYLDPLAQKYPFLQAY
jgi:hypothetical protein